MNAYLADELLSVKSVLFPTKMIIMSGSA